MNIEEKLYGGNVNEVIRVNDTVRRTGRNTNVQNLLKYLEANGFQGVPRFLGIEEKDREILSFIPGEVPGNDYPDCRSYVWSDRTLEHIARFLRGFHDVTQNFIQTAAEAGWTNPYLKEYQYEVICHNDAAPYNFVFKDELPVGLIDFDMASPGMRIWDIAYTLYTTIPLSSFEPEHDKAATIPYVPELHSGNRQRRIDLFFEAYGINKPKDLKDWVIKRIQALCDTLKTGAEQGNAAFQTMIDEGHLAHYENELLFLQEHFEDWNN